jgi:hypothetical protein
VDQHAEVAHLLGDLVQGHGDRRGDAERRAHQERAGDDRAVHEVVHPVADQVREHHRLHVAVLGGVQLVMEVDELLEDVQEQDRQRHHPGQLDRDAPALGELGQEVEQRVAEQGADREAHQDRNDPAEEPFLDDQSHDAHERDRAHREDGEDRRAPDRCGGGQHGPRLHDRPSRPGQGVRYGRSGRATSTTCCASTMTSRPSG